MTLRYGMILSGCALCDAAAVRFAGTQHPEPRRSATPMDTIFNLAVAVGILGLSAVLTGLFTRKMYYRCRQCGTLNAKRRIQCRACGQALP